MNVKLSNALKAGAILSVALLGLSACAANETDTGTSETPNSSAPSDTPGASETPDVSLTGSLVGAGASSMGEAQNVWIASYNNDVESGVTINYDPAGSGTGRENFQQGASQFAGSDRAFKVDEIAEGPFEMCAADSGLVELPVYISPIAIVFNLEGIDTLNLDADSLSQIFLGEITNWNDPVIASQNEDVDLPDTAISPVHRADKSGTTGNFTDYLAAASDLWEHGSVEEWPLDSGEAAQQTSGMASAVENGVGTIGYIDASRAGDLGLVNVKVGDAYVPYSPEAAAAVIDDSELAEGRTANDLAININRASEAAGVYPIILISYAIGCETYANADDAELVKSYFSHIISPEAQQLSAENAGSAPITNELREKMTAAVNAIS